MPSQRPTRKGIGGIGAVFFLGTLGVIAFYVQRQTVPADRDVQRKRATIVPDAAPEEKPVALPWEDRLDLQTAQLAPLVPATQVQASAQSDGAKGARPVETIEDVDPASARYVQGLGDGHRILLTLDPVLQQSALTIFRNRDVPYAAAVVVDLRDSSVLAMAGHSSMDPEVDPLEVVATAWAPAASTFKLVTAAGLLETGNVTPHSKACFRGGLHGIKDDDLRDDPARDTRCETLTDAIAHSYNLVIGKLALRHLGQEQLSDIAHQLMFEADIDFEFNVARSPAHIPSDPLERAKVAAGFWNVDLSPIHGAVLASIFARRGVYQPLHVIDQVLAPDGTDLTPSRPRSSRVLSKATAESVAKMMESTTTTGTARKSFRDRQGNDYVRGMRVAGKTGSLTGKKPPALNYNWFLGFAPAEHPEIAFAVLLANKPKWRIKAHYAARRLVQIYQERAATITRHRDARLTAKGVELPRRDESGAIVSRPTKPGPGAKPSNPAKAAANDNAGDTTKVAAPQIGESTPLPPPPDQTPPSLPPIPGALPKPPDNAAGA